MSFELSFMAILDPQIFDPNFDTSLRSQCLVHERL